MFRAFRTSPRKNDLGQDLAEYCLLTALLAMVALGILYHFSGGMDGIWGSVNAKGPPGSTISSTARTPAS